MFRCGGFCVTEVSGSGVAHTGQCRRLDSAVSGPPRPRCRLSGRPRVKVRGPCILSVRSRKAGGGGWKARDRWLCPEKSRHRLCTGRLHGLCYTEDVSTHLPLAFGFWAHIPAGRCYGPAGQGRAGPGDGPTHGLVRRAAAHVTCRATPQALSRAPQPGLCPSSFITERSSRRGGMASRVLGRGFNPRPNTVG